VHRAVKKQKRKSYLCGSFIHFVGAGSICIITDRYRPRANACTSNSSSCVTGLQGPTVKEYFLFMETWPYRKKTRVLKWWFSRRPPNTVLSDIIERLTSLDVVGAILLVHRRSDSWLTLHCDCRTCLSLMNFWCHFARVCPAIGAVIRIYLSHIFEFFILFAVSVIMLKFLEDYCSWGIY